MPLPRKEKPLFRALCFANFVQLHLFSALHSFARAPIVLLVPLFLLLPLFYCHYYSFTINTISTTISMIAIVNTMTIATTTGYYCYYFCYLVATGLFPGMVVGKPIIS